MVSKIVSQSAGSLAMALLALLLLIVQSYLFLRRSRFTWCAWSAAISFSALLYSVGVFLEYNTPQGALNRFSGLLEWTAIVCLIHSIYGFTFSHLGIKSKRYHPIAGLCHGLVLAFLWLSNFLIARSFVTRDFIGVDSPYVEPALGPFGPAFMLYGVIATLNVMRIWVKSMRVNPNHQTVFLAGIGFWLAVGIHDGLAAMGMPTLQYFMEYGFLGFAMALLWVVFANYLESATDEDYRAITELANDSILVVQDGKVVFRNPACNALIGQLSTNSSNDFLGIVAPEDHEVVLDNYNRLLAGDRVSDAYTIRIQRPSGDHRFVEMASSVIQYRHRPAVLGVMRDVTQRKREEEVLRQTEQKLARYKKMESLGLLAGGVAHDLNNVLAGIVGYPDLILRDLPEDSDLRDPIERMQESGYRAAAITEDLLTVARGVSFAKEPLNLNDLVGEFSRSPELRRLNEYHPTVMVKTSLDRDLLNTAGSTIHIRKALMNLVSNASEAIEGIGSVTISTMNRYVEKPLRGYDDVEPGEYAVLSVSDDGPGIAADDLERVFEPFFTKKMMGRSGTGLGLTVVWNVTRDHEGYIDTRSNENGTTFDLYFPATRVEVSARALSVPFEDIRGHGETILVVDDAKSQREISCKMLAALGYRTEAVSSGEEGVGFLKEHPVDLVLLDMIMDPGINGRETFERISKIRPNQRVVIVSGFAETDEVRKTLELGAGRYLKKPITLASIGMAVKEELGK